jgi:hypothetical protein
MPIELPNCTAEAGDFVTDTAGYSIGAHAIRPSLVRSMVD